MKRAKRDDTGEFYAHVFYAWRVADDEERARQLRTLFLENPNEYNRAVMQLEAADRRVAEESEKWRVRLRRRRESNVPLPPSPQLF